MPIFHKMSSVGRVVRFTKATASLCAYPWTTIKTVKNQLTVSLNEGELKTVPAHTTVLSVKPYIGIELVRSDLVTKLKSGNFLRKSMPLYNHAMFVWDLF
jgi:hypothetical protein